MLKQAVVLERLVWLKSFAWLNWQQIMLYCGSILTVAGAWGAAMPNAVAAQRLTLLLGPLKQTIAVVDLEQFAQTGKLSPALQLYAPVLTPSVQQALNRKLQLDANLGEPLIKQLLQSPTGNKLISSLAPAFPESTIPQLETTVTLAFRQTKALSIISLLQAYPQTNVTVDVSAAAAIALEFNPTYWQSQILSPFLEQSLASNNHLPLPPFDPALPGPQAVQMQTLWFQDQQRHRLIPVDIYWSSNTQGPLVVISHGLGANRKTLAYLARHLASYGITVAALEHPGSNSSWFARVSSASYPGELFVAREFIDRPKDVSFLLDQLAQLNQQPGPLQGKLNTHQVSVIGHSLGGYTALALAGGEVNLAELRQFCRNAINIGYSVADWFECAASDLPDSKFNLKDQRVVEVIALNPLVGHIFGTTGLTKITIPVLLLAGTEDSLTPIINNQIRPFTQFAGSKYLLTAIGGTHLSVLDPANLASTVTQTTLVKERQGEATKSLRSLVAGVSLAFIEQLTPAAKTYTLFLTPTYAQAFSTPELPLRLNTELPPSITPWLNVLVEVSQLPDQMRHSLYRTLPIFMLSIVLLQKKVYKF